MNERLVDAARGEAAGSGEGCGREERATTGSAGREGGERERRLMRAARETLKCRLHVHAGSARETERTQNRGESKSERDGES